MTDSPKRPITIDEIPGPDFTIYRQAEPIARDSAEEEGQPREGELEEGEELPSDCFRDDEGKKRYSCSPSLSIRCGGKETDVRALACRAYRGKVWSITIRCEERNERKGGDNYIGRVRARLQGYAPQESGQDVRLKDFLGYCPGGYAKYSKPIGGESSTDNVDIGEESSSGTVERPREVFLNDIYSLCESLYGVLFDKKEAASHPGGLVVITGATDSSKSLITRGLIFLLMEKAAERAFSEGNRKPHLVTFEDPIEKYYVKIPAGAKAAHADSGHLPLEDLKSLLDAFYIDYTPRERGADADNLKHVVEDALRQTPAVLFVGETREREDWKDLLRFANTGHLVITTSHAKSVVEAMSDIFRETETKTQAQRSEIARRILGVVNVRRFTPPGSSVRALLPALWKSTPKSTANLVADGLASILPAPDRGYYGRKYFAKVLTAKPTQEVSRIDEPERGKILEEIMEKANEWDFEGV